MASFTIYLTDENNNTTNGVIRIYDSNYQRVIEETTIDGSIINVELPLGSYFIRVYSSSHTFLPKTVVIEDNAIYRLVGSSVLLNTPPDTSVCRIYGKLVDAVGNPLRGWTIGIFANDGMYNRGDALSSTTGSAVSDASGSVEFDVLRNCDYIFSNVPIVAYSSTIYDVVSRLVHIPDQPVCSLIDVVIPIPVLVTAEASYTGPTVSINPIVFMSNGTQLDESYERYQICAYIQDTKAVYDRTISSFVFSNIAPGDYRVLFKTSAYSPVGATNASQSLKRVGPERNINYIDITVS